MNEDRFADVLDGMVSGTTLPDADPLARFAKHIHEQETDTLADNHRTAIWRNLMATHAHDTPTSGGPGPLAQPALTDPTTFNPWAARSTFPALKRTRMGVINDGIQVSITALAIVAVVIAAFAAFPVLRGDRMAEVTPTAFAAAPTVEGGGDNQGAVPPLSATPNDEDTAWLAYIQPEECSAEPLDDDAIATIIASPDAGEAREYIPLTTPAPQDAEAAARIARTADACGLGSDGNPPVMSALMTDRFIAEQHDADEPGSFDDARARDIEIGKQISAAYPSSDPAALVRLSAEMPTRLNEAENEGDIASYAYLPSMAIQFPDGRIGVPGVIMFWEESPNAPTQEQIDALPWMLTGMAVLTDESGMWQVDELLPFCLGDCEEGWAMWAGDATPEATPKAQNPDLLPLPGTPAAQTPEPTASLPSGDIPQPTQHPVEPLPLTTAPTLYRHPRATDCTVEPLTVDEIMEILEGKSSGRGDAGGQLQHHEPMDETTYDALADAQRSWLACRVYGSPFQMWALESDELIRTELRQAYFPHYNLGLIREDLVQMRNETTDAGTNVGFTWEPPSDTYIPMVPEYDANALPMSDHATLPIVWMNRDGDVIPAPGTDDGAPVNSMESRLPNTWLFVQDEHSGLWLLDGYGVQWGVTSTTILTGSDGNSSQSTMQPVQPLPDESHAAPSQTTSGGDNQGSSQPTEHAIEPITPTVVPEPTSAG